jgi:hypothetical protein
MRAAWTASGACTSGSTGRREGETRSAAPATRSTGSAATTSTTSQTGPANNLTRPGRAAIAARPDAGLGSVRGLAEFSVGSFALAVGLVGGLASSASGRGL